MHVDIKLTKIEYGRLFAVDFFMLATNILIIFLYDYFWISIDKKEKTR